MDTKIQPLDRCEIVCELVQSAYEIVEASKKFEARVNAELPAGTWLKFAYCDRADSIRVFKGMVSKNQYAVESMPSGGLVIEVSDEYPGYRDACDGRVSIRWNQIVDVLK